MKTFPGFFLIFAVLRSGEPLRCEKCYKDGLTCSGRNRLCDYDLKTCVVVLVEYTHYGKPQLRAVKTCEHTNVCNTPLQYLNMGRGIYERSNVICCIGEACKTAAPRLQPGFINPNGKSCPACFATDISHCGSARVDCSGNEFYCMSTFHEVWEHGNIVTYIKRGCATKELCDQSSGSYIADRATFNYRPNCTKAI
ncbi:phospholipase A2 inhibitor gamma subunit B-like [Anolis sagrei]|uniref:phospholipase A2 inhibitor gamma subunit B-like n=1 Tax=Anolis sagrei TaxID=38937 RepID=UPI0035218B39